jgi:hypothetical protein
MSQTRLEPEGRVPILRDASVRECVAYLLQGFIAVLQAEEDSDKHGEHCNANGGRRRHRSVSINPRGAPDYLHKNGWNHGPTIAKFSA